MRCWAPAQSASPARNRETRLCLRDRGALLLAGGRPIESLAAISPTASTCTETAVRRDAPRWARACATPVDAALVGDVRDSAGRGETQQRRMVAANTGVHMQTLVLLRVRADPPRGRAGRGATPAASRWTPVRTPRQGAPVARHETRDSPPPGKPEHERAHLLAHERRAAAMGRRGASCHNGPNVAVAPPEQTASPVRTDHDRDQLPTGTTGWLPALRDLVFVCHLPRVLDRPARQKRERAGASSAVVLPPDHGFGREDRACARTTRLRCRAR
jgi:hypothetical protein